ncbi:MAG: DUF6602 domain-containing protein, partial [Gaiellales bacterium]
MREDAVVGGSEADRARPPHELGQFMRDVSYRIAASYERIRGRASDDPGTAGDQGEENWAHVIREWLPAGYHVETKGRLLSTTGDASSQVDVIVLRPSYLRGLLNTKLYLAEGVAAAFECKVTLRAKHIADAVETAAALRQLFRPREGSTHRELSSPLVFGLLAHSHDWKGPESTPEENIRRALIEADSRFCSHPRETLDILSVADLGTWTVMKNSGLGPALLGDGWPASRDLYGYPPEGGISTMFVGPRSYRPADKPTPFGTMFAALLRRLAWEDAQLRSIADYFNACAAGGRGRLPAHLAVRRL